MEPCSYIKQLIFPIKYQPGFRLNGNNNLMWVGLYKHLDDIFNRRCTSYALSHLTQPFF